MLKKLILTACLCLLGIGVSYGQDQVSKTGDIGTIIDLTLTGPTGPSSIWGVGGNTQLAVQGSDQACDDGARHFSEVYIPYKMSITGIFYLVGSVGGTDSVTCELFTSAGVLVTGGTSAASTVKQGAIVGTAAQFQKCAFTDGVITVGPGRYFISAQFSGTTAKFRSPTITGTPGIVDEDSGTVHTDASITPGTAFVADKGIIGGVY